MPHSLCAALLLSLAPWTAALAHDEPGSTFEPVELSPAVRAAIDDPLLDEASRRRLAIFHGQDSAVPAEALDAADRAAVALAQGRWSDAELSDPAAPLLLRARAALRRGEPQVAAELLHAEQSLPAVVLCAAALEQLGQYPKALARLLPLRDRLQAEKLSDPADLVAAGQAVLLLALLQGRPAEDYHLALSLFTKAHDEADRFHWPALLAEAQLLADKGNRNQAAQALQQALTLNPNAAEAWHLLGQLNAWSFNFAAADHCAQRLREIHSAHPLADLLDAESFLMQKDAASARAVIDPALSRWPAQRDLLALSAAAYALAQDAQLELTLTRFDELSPGSAQAYFTVGRVLSLARQYARSGQALREAVRRQPNWPAPQAELGLMLMQWGREDEARRVLAAAAALDPFNTRTANQLRLVEKLATYPRIETEHFTIRHAPGIDAVLASDMAQQLDAMYREVTDVFGHRPRQRTLIELMPDEEHFAVRITGTPELWTIAAATGDVIALTPPRFGVKQHGSFDWYRVLRHEFVHTVTLDQTDNRIAHWFTEACAVAQEPGGRDYATAQLLAASLHADKLFSLSNITWGFIRPKNEAERPLAYAQAHWMYEFIAQRFGHAAILEMLRLYQQGMTDPRVVEQATDLAESLFMESFRGWAEQQVRSWGLGPHEGDREVRQLTRRDAPPTPSEVTRLLEQFPDHPELLRLRATHALEAAPPEEALAAVLRYAATRPVDPWSDKAVAQLALTLGRTEQAIASLRELDRMEQESGLYAAELARHFTGESARTAITRALHREPYNASYRELAAAIELKLKDDKAALRHLRALTLLEPERALHFTRLAALLHRMQRTDEARAAARRARQLDPAAPVEKFLADP